MVFCKALGILRTKGVMALMKGEGSRVDGHTLAPLGLPIDEDQGGNVPVKLLGVAMIQGLEPDDVLHASGEVGDLSQVPILVD